MKTSLKSLITLTTLAFLAGPIAQTRASLPNDWINVGASPGGGFIIDGSGATNLGPLGPSTFPVYLSPNGSNIITLGAGSMAVYGGAEVIDLESPANTLNNFGLINNITSSDYGVLANSNGNIINNWGTINGYYAIVAYNANNVINNWGGITSGYYGIYLNGTSSTVNNWGTISGASVAAIYNYYGKGDVINNWGLVTSASDAAVYNYYSTNQTFNNMGTVSAIYYGFLNYGTNITTNNWGTIYSPYLAVYEDGTSNTVNNWGMILSSTYGVYNDGANFTLNNMPTGVITGGDGYYPVYNDGANFVLNNQGSILLNNGGGYAVYLAGNGGVINNSGLISGAGGYGIYLAGSNNIVNLTGHSSVIGTIAATGANNTVNVNFTGMSPAAQAALVTQILAQGGPANFTGTFTVRGVTYVFDPVNIGLQLKSYQLQGITPNQKAIGASLDSVTFNPAPGTPLWSLFNGIDNSGNVPGALEALSPEKYAIYGSLAIENATGMVQNIDARLNNLRDGSESVDTTGVGGGVTSGAIVTGDPSKDSGKESKGVVQPAPEKNRWGFFATGDGLFLRGATQGLGGQTGKADSAGTLIGVDGKVGEHAIIGTFFSYNNSAAILGADGSHATVQSYSGGLYGTWHQDGFYVNSLAAYTRNNYDSQRNILIPGFGSNAAGSTDGNQATVNLDGGYDWHVSDRLTAGPIAGLQYVHLDVDGFNETGSLASLGIGSQSMDSLQSRLGARLDYHIATTSTSSFAAEFYAAWQHEYLNDSRSINASFQGGGLAPFSVQTGSPQRDAAVVGASLNFSFHNRLTLFAGYELQLWQSSSFEQSINGGARISF